MPIDRSNIVPKPNPSHRDVGFAFAALAGLAVVCGPVLAHDVIELPEFQVEGRGTTIVGQAISASQGYVGRVDLEARPMLRPAELLEMVPGLIVTQHSGSGKANQYFLRGFNLDHGTDFATWVDGMPANLVSHAHGQGYADLNFVIPELVEMMSYYKGAYYAHVGDFSATGSASIRTVSALPDDIARIAVGENGYARAVYANSQAIGVGTLLAGIELQADDGPWAQPERLSKLNGLFKYTLDDGDVRTSVSLMGYDSRWDATDQIPRRAVESGDLDRLGNIDDTVGGQSSRYSLALSRLDQSSNDKIDRASLYAVFYDMNLWSNFTYFLDDPENGDQFEQADKRMIYGGSLTRTLLGRTLFDKALTQTIGLQARYEDIGSVGLYKTRQRQRLETVREDAIGELAAGVFYDAQMQVTRRLRASFGGRVDYYRFEVESDLPANSGDAEDALFSPKLSFGYKATESLEVYASAGSGFHSNDARGATIAIDPADRETSVERVDPLARSRGFEVGARFDWDQRFNASLALWTLDLDSELLYVGDAGATEASLPSSRRGVELATYFAPTRWLVLDADLAFTDARFRDAPAGVDAIPGAVESVASAGVTVQRENGAYGALRLRRFGPRALVEDGSARSRGSTSMNLRIGYRVGDWDLALDILNLADAEVDDISYYYASRLPGEPEEGVGDFHFHPLLPRAARLLVGYRF